MNYEYYKVSRWPDEDFGLRHSLGLVGWPVQAVQGCPNLWGKGGQLHPLPFLAGGKGGKGAFFQKYNINKI